jgi:hypothetical protein
VAIWPFFIFGGLVFLFWVAALSLVLMRQQIGGGTSNGGDLVVAP